MYFNEEPSTEGKCMNYYVPNSDASPRKRKRNDVQAPQRRRGGRILGRRYALTAAGYKYLEIGIDVGSPSYVEIAIGDNRENELTLSLETWKGLYEHRWSIHNFLQNGTHRNSFPLSIGPLTVRYSTLDNVTLACIDAANVRIMMTNATLFNMFNLDGCVDVVFSQLNCIIDKVDVKYTQFANIASTIKMNDVVDVIRSSDCFNERELIDCELLALIIAP